MDTETFQTHLKAYQGFIRECPFDKGDILPIYAMILEWPATGLVQSFERDQPFVLKWESIELHSQNQESPQGNDPYFEAKWTLSLKILEVKTDLSTIEKYHVPLDKAKWMDYLAPQSRAINERDVSASASIDEHPVKTGIRTYTHRVLAEPGRPRPSEPNCVLLAVIKVEYPDRITPIVHFTHAEISIRCDGSEREKLVCDEPLETYALAEGVYALNSSKTAHWNNRFERRPSIHGVRKKSAWLGLLNGVDAGDVCLYVEFQLNEESFAKIGFPFGGNVSVLPKDIVDQFKVQQTDEDVPLQFDGTVVFMKRDSLSTQSSYFKSFLSNWNTDKLKFPFENDDGIIGQVLYFIRYGVIVPLSAQNCVDLFFAAEALGMDGLRERMEVFMVPFMNQENVTQIIRLAWENKADLLLRVASLYLKANYEAMWVKDNEDLKQLGKLLSDPQFPVQFGVLHNRE